MQRRTKMIVGVTIALALVFGGVAAAFAAHAISLSVKPARVMYPHKSNVTVGLDGYQSSPATVTVQYRYVDGDGVWKNWKTITAARSAVATKAVFPATASILKGTIEFRALESGVATSQVATVTVLARLSKPHVSQPMRHKAAARTVTVRGMIWPAHPSGKDTVKLEFAKYDGNTLIPHPAMTRMVKIAKGRTWDRYTRDFMSSWGVSLPALSKGRWQVKASHVDTAHAMSFTTSSFTAR